MSRVLLLLPEKGPRNETAAESALRSSFQPYFGIFSRFVCLLLLAAVRVIRRQRLFSGFLDSAVSREATISVLCVLRRLSFSLSEFVHTCVQKASILLRAVDGWMMTRRLS